MKSPGLLQSNHRRYISQIYYNLIYLFIIVRPGLSPGRPFSSVSGISGVVTDFHPFLSEKSPPLSSRPEVQWTGVEGSAFLEAIPVANVPTTLDMTYRGSYADMNKLT